MAGEHVILLDEQDKPTGMLEKYAAHTLNTPLHLAFSSWLFNEQGQLLVMQAADDNARNALISFSRQA